MKHSFQPFTEELMECNPFEKIGKEWMLVTAGSPEKANTMTASWGGMGVMWGKDVVYIVIRQSRYTKEFIEQEKSFSLSFLGEKHRNMLKYLGTVSGRTEDKIKEAGVEIDYKDGIPYVDEAQLVLLCKVMSATELTPEQFWQEDIKSTWYQDEDYHTLYIAEITDFLAR
jgi:flavin reductase (DIM6/NTAB) family NADH-FMN oxidoreductase RutF